MSSLVFIVFGAGIFGILLLGVFWLKKESKQSSDKLIEGFDAFQRTLFSNQKGFEALQETKASVLRQELLQEFQHNRQELQLVLNQNQKGINDKVESLEGKVEKRLKELSQGVQTELQNNVKEGFKHFEKVSLGLKQAELQLLQLNQVGASINQLNQLLKLPHLRGGFGESQMERLFEDLLPPTSYEFQYAISAGSQERVDAVIKFPNGVLPVDCKFPREQVLPLFETEDPGKLEQARKVLADCLKIQAKKIKEKYIRPEQGTTEMALLFLPSETLYFEVLQNSKLVDDLRSFKVFPVSPHTLMMTLQSISIAQGYYEMAKGVEKTLENLRKTKQHMDHFGKKFDDIGDNLNKALASHQVARTHLDRYHNSLVRFEEEKEKERDLELNQ